VEVKAGGCGWGESVQGARGKCQDGVNVLHLSRDEADNVLGPQGTTAGVTLSSRFNFFYLLFMATLIVCRCW